MDEENRRQLTTSKVLSRIRAADSPSEATAYHALNGEPILKDVLYQIMQKNGFQPKDIILESGIERSYFYHILSGYKHPSRNMMLRIGLCVHADCAEMNRLLRLAGVSGLYPKIRRDALLLYALQEHWSMARTNTLLIESGEPPLYREEKRG
ncbi:MAG: hypothetical protein IJ074_07520 [Clostridia bacterium]|nr:hypothetical protein [Clostridia bacterium]